MFLNSENQTFIMDEKKIEVFLKELLDASFDDVEYSKAVRIANKKAGTNITVMTSKI